MVLHLGNNPSHVLNEEYRTQVPKHSVRITQLRKVYVGPLLPVSQQALPHLQYVLCPRTDVLSVAVVSVRSPRA